MSWKFVDFFLPVVEVSLFVPHLQHPVMTLECVGFITTKFLVAYFYVFISLKRNKYIKIYARAYVRSLKDH